MMTQGTVSPPTPERPVSGSDLNAKALRPMDLAAARFDNLQSSVLPSAMAGVRLVQPVAIYQQVERSVKYGALIIVFTFVALLVMEFAGGMRFHVVQYGLGAMAVEARIGWYLRMVVGRWRPTRGLSTLLVALYVGSYLLSGAIATKDAPP